MHMLKNVLKGYAYLASANIFSALMKVIIMSLITIYLLEPTEFGIYNVMIVIASFMILGVNWFFPAAIVRFGREDIEKKRTMNLTFWCGLSVTGVTFLVISALFLILRKLIAESLSISISYPLAFTILLYFLAYTSFTFLLIMLQTELKFKYFSMAQMSMNFLFALLVLAYFDMATVYTPLVLLLLLSLSYLTVTLIGMRNIERSNVRAVTVTKRRLREMLRYTWPNLLGSLAAFVYYQADKVALKYYYSNEAVGIYSLAVMFLWALLAFPELLTSITFPLITSFRFQKNMRYIEYYTSRTLCHLMLLTSVAMVIISFLALFLIPILYNNSYALATTPFVILMIGALFASLRRFLSPLFGAFDLLKQLNGIAWVSALAELLFLYVLVPPYGITGASIAMALMMVVDVLIAFFYLSIKLRMKTTTRPIFMVIPAAITIGIFLIIPNVYFRIIALCVGIVTYIGIAWFFRIFDARDLSIIQHLTMPKKIKESLLAVGNYFVRAP